MTLYRVLMGAAVLGGAFLTYRVPNGPLLFWWLSSALVLGTWVAFSRRGTGLRRRAGRLVLLYDRNNNSLIEVGEVIEAQGVDAPQPADDVKIAAHSREILRLQAKRPP